MIGVHTPEFGFEQQLPNVQRAVDRFGVTFPVAESRGTRIWELIPQRILGLPTISSIFMGKCASSTSARGATMNRSTGSSSFWKQRSATGMPSGMVDVQAQGVEAASDAREVRSPETYIGYARADRFASPGGIRRNQEHLYTPPSRLRLNQWGLSGSWADHAMGAVLQSAGGEVVFHFHARDLHLVLGPAGDGKPVRFRVTLDGQAPGENHGVDTDADGNGVVTGYRLYQLVEAARSRRRSHLHDRVPRSRSPGIFLYLRLKLSWGFMGGDASSGVMLVGAGWHGVGAYRRARQKTFSQLQPELEGPRTPASLAATSAIGFSGTQAGSRTEQRADFAESFVCRAVHNRNELVTR